jgi:hypothetical protein
MLIPYSWCSSHGSKVTFIALQHIMRAVVFLENTEYGRES